MMLNAISALYKTVKVLLRELCYIISAFLIAGVSGSIILVLLYTLVLLQNYIKGF